MSVTPTSPGGPPRSADLEALEIDLLLQSLFEHYGYDFREYARASLKRRIWSVIQKEGVKTISGLQERLLHDAECMERFLLAVSVNVTSLFRDPGFFLAFRQTVVPMLRTYPFIRIWHAGCSTGEEVYSMAILLEEEGIYDRCRIYATDMNVSVLRQAREGIFSLEHERLYSTNYQDAGGARQLADYYTSAYGSAMFRSDLKRNLVFSEHNLVSDQSFNEFHVILCRNVMIYFRKPLQDRVHRLVYDSLVTFGILGLGSKETIHFSPHERDYQQLLPEWKLYRKVR
jgi:chemotaxis protein methyltransferase CheR